MLKIYVQSHETGLEYVKVNGMDTVKMIDGTYYINIDVLGEIVEINARAIDENSDIRIETDGYEKQETTRDKLIDAKETVVYIYVRAEGGTLQKYTLLVSGLPDDATLKKVIVNGEEAIHLEGQNKYQIRLSEDTYEIQGITTDSLAKISINGEADEVETQTINITKEGTKTIIKIKVTAQNKVDTGEYTLEITEKSNDNTLAYVIVNGKNAKREPDGSYKAEVKENIENAEIKIGAKDAFSTVYLGDDTQNKNNIIVTKELTEVENTYKIKVIAENGEEAEYTLVIKKLSENTNIEKVEVITRKEVEDEETSEISVIETIEQAEEREDGNYYLKINRENKADVKVTLEDINASVKIKDSAFIKAVNTKEVELLTEITEVEIEVKAEDGTTRKCKLILEKKSNDTALKEINSSDIQKINGMTIYVDESFNEIDITLVTNHDLASIKMQGEDTFEPKTITRKIDLTKEVPEDQEREIIVVIQAEDGTEEEHVIKIVKTAEIGLQSVKANTEEIVPKDGTYKKRVEAKETANMEITAIKEDIKIEIIERVLEGEVYVENVIGTGTRKPNHRCTTKRGTTKLCNQNNLRGRKRNRRL